MKTLCMALAVILGALILSKVCLASDYSGVVLGRDGKPAVAAPVWLLGSRGSLVGKTSSDANGGFRFDGIGLSCESVAARVDGAAYCWATITGPFGRFTGSVARFELRSEKGVDVDGLVLNSKGKPVSGADVRVLYLRGSAGFWSDEMNETLNASELPGMSAVSDADGRFTIRHVPVGVHVVLGASSGDLTIAYDEVDLPDQPAPRVGFRGGTGFEVFTSEVGRNSVVLRLKPRATICGAVFMHAKPQPGAKVELSWAHVVEGEAGLVADKNGAFKMSAEPGWYWVTARCKDGLTPRSELFCVQSGDVAKLRLELERGTRVEGSISLEGLRADEWHLAAVQSPEDRKSALASFDKARSDEDGWLSRPVQIGNDGRFQATLLPGKWSIDASSAKGILTGTVVVPTGGVGNGVTATLHRSQRRMPVSIRAHVRDEQGNPVEYARVSAPFHFTGIGPGFVAVQTDANGNANLPGWIRATAFAASSDFRRMGFGTPASDPSDVEVVLKDAVEIRGGAVDGGGSGISGATCSVALSNSQTAVFTMYSVKTDEAGRYRCRVPAGARYEIFVSKDGYAAAKTPLSEAPNSGAAQVDDVVLQKNDGVLEGVAVDDRGRPIPYAPVYASWISSVTFENARASCTDAAGKFSIRDLPHGLPNEARISVGLVPTEEYGEALITLSSDGAAAVKLRAARRGDHKPVTFSVGSPLLSPAEVEWVEGKPARAGQGGFRLLFVKAGDPASESACRRATDLGTISGIVGRTVLVFDASMSVGELRTYLKAHKILGRIVRVKDGPNSGRGGGLFVRARISSVPTCVSLDQAGHLGKPEPYKE